MKLNSLCLMFALCVSSHALAQTLKFGIVTPKGTTWTNLVEEMDDELRERSKGKVKLKVQAGGKKGDEIDMLRSMERGILHAAAFSGVGLERLVKDIRILEAPLLFKTHEEIDAVKEALYPYWEKKFSEKGYVLLGFAEAGFVNVFSKQKIANNEALKNVKMWVWTGDSVASEFLKEFKINGVPLHLSDVTVGLDTGMIDSFYSPPLASVAFQWYAKVKYMLDYPFVNSTGAFIFKKDAFEKLSSEHQTLLREVAKKYAQKIVDASRKDNKQAKEILKKNGIEFLQPSEADIKVFNQYANQVHKKLIPGTYSQELYDKVAAILKEKRK